METRHAARIRMALTGTTASVALVWIWWILDPSAPASPLVPGIATLVLAANIPLTVARPDVKRALVAAIQRFALNPMIRLMFRIGFVPFGYALLETTGRRTGRTHVVPVGNGLEGDVFWIIAEHGYRAGYVNNLIAQPKVRLKFRRGLRFEWHEGLAEVLPEADALQRQRTISRRHPLRILNAIVVRTLGTDLLVIRVALSERV
ncbi:nitroreductase/quinone reductase family protein [Nocardia sp. NPDC059240]|uniref:nitroreductase/quinone reductase family protein n=1 Tax=Nocardia sp. NPDC059240 TaxID=3346786 RepID=UPI0036A43306